MACNLFALAPGVEIVDGKRLLIGRGGRDCSGAPGDTELTVRVRIRHHRTFRFDRTLAEVTRTGTALDISVAYECQGSSGKRVFTETLAAGNKTKSPRVYVECG